jgi:flagellar capping protein FliD
MTVAERNFLSRRQVVVKLFAERAADDVITYEELATALDLHSVRDRGMIRSTVYSARVELANEHKRTLSAVTGVGYRIIRPEEHLPAAALEQRKAGRALVSAKRTVDTVPMGELTAEQRKQIMLAATVLGWQTEQFRMMDLRTRNLENLVASVTTKIETVEEQTDERLAAMEQRLRALEQTEQTEQGSAGQG